MKEQDSIVRRLVESRKITAVQAEELRHAIDLLEKQSKNFQDAGEAGLPVGRNALLLANLISQNVTKDQYLETVKKNAGYGGMLYGVLMGILFPPLFYLSLPASDFLHTWNGWSLAAGWALLFLFWVFAGGGLFSFLMYRFFWKPRAVGIIDFLESVGRQEPDLPNPELGQCPACGGRNSTPCHWTKLAVLHWIVNPALAFNEIILGQRIPRNMKQCRVCQTDFANCENCKSSIHAADLSEKAFGNWSGFRCRWCDHRLPCYRNALAGLLLLPYYAVCGLRALFAENTARSGSSEV